MKVGDLATSRERQVATVEGAVVAPFYACSDGCIGVIDAGIEATRLLAA